MNASLSVRLYHKQKKSPGCVSNKRPVIWHLQDVRVWEEKENVKGNKCMRQKKIEDHKPQETVEPEGFQTLN